MIKSTAKLLFVLFSMTMYFIGYALGCVFGLFHWAFCIGLDDGQDLMDETCEHLFGNDTHDMFVADYSECQHGVHPDECPVCRH